MGIYNREIITIGNEKLHGGGSGYAPTEGKAEEVCITEFTNDRRGYLAKADDFRGLKVVGDSIVQIASALRAAAAIDPDQHADRRILAGFIKKFPGVRILEEAA